MPTVESSVIAEIEYYAEVEMLVVYFISGKKYVYEKVPEDVYYYLLKAESVGAYYNEKVKGQFNSTKF